MVGIILFILWVVCLTHSAIKKNPTGPFTILEPQSQEIGELYIAQKHRLLSSKIVKRLVGTCYEVVNVEQFKWGAEYSKKNTLDL